MCYARGKVLTLLGVRRVGTSLDLVETQLLPLPTYNNSHTHDETQRNKHCRKIAKFRFVGVVSAVVASAISSLHVLRLMLLLPLLLCRSLLCHSIGSYGLGSLIIFFPIGIYAVIRSRQVERRWLEGDFQVRLLPNVCSTRA